MHFIEKFLTFYTLILYEFTKSGKTAKGLPKPVKKVEKFEIFAHSKISTAVIYQRI